MLTNDYTDELPGENEEEGDGDTSRDWALKNAYSLQTQVVDWLIVRFIFVLNSYEILKYEF